MTLLFADILPGLYLVYFISLRCPPYTQKKSNLIAWVMKKPIKSGGSSIFSSLFGFVKLVVFGVFIGFLAKVTYFVK